jgi:small subunit ribosomal protein S14
MKHLIIKERSHRKNFKQLESQYLSLKTIVSNEMLSSFIRFEANLLLTHFLYKKSRTSLRNRCFLTGRGRGFSRFFHLSRLQTRSLARNNDLPFIKKSSW